VFWRAGGVKYKSPGDQAAEDTGLARGDDRAECARGEESALEQAPAIAKI
jgi:hypothetical protein